MFAVPQGWLSFNPVILDRGKYLLHCTVYTMNKGESFVCMCCLFLGDSSSVGRVGHADAVH